MKGGALDALISAIEVKGAGDTLPLLLSYVGAACPYCGNPMDPSQGRKPTRDHIKAKSKGGTLADGNKAVVCEVCNGDKKNKHIEGFLISLLRRGDARALHVAAFILRNRASVYEPENCEVMG